MASSSAGTPSSSSRGDRYLQLDTFGSTERQIPGKTSQSIQLNERSAAQLKILIERAFPGIGARSYV
jgi:hypothetical protein